MQVRQVDSNDAGRRQFSAVLQKSLRTSVFFLFKTKPLCVAFVTLIPILPTPGAQADELPRNAKF